MLLCSCWRSELSHRVVEGQWNGWNVKHTGIRVSCVFTLRAVYGVGTPEHYTN